MKYKLNMFNISSAILVVGVVLYSIFNIDDLRRDEFMRIVMAFFAACGILGGLFDFLLQKFLKNYRTVLIVELCLAIAISLLFLFDLAMNA